MTDSEEDRDFENDTTTTIDQEEDYEQEPERDEDYEQEPEQEERDEDYEREEQDGDLDEREPDFEDKEEEPIVEETVEDLEQVSEPYELEAPEFGISYKQLEQISRGDPDLTYSIGIGGKRLQYIVMAQTVAKKKLYLNKLSAELSTYFSYAQIEGYKDLITKVPRFWLKNSEAFVAIIRIYDQLKGDTLTPKILDSFANQTGIKAEDIYRYYKLVKRSQTI